ncbi:unnamed protein product [Trichobilharzia regenti]|nr:unnamed protein product [Trichobilharzia regenti]
MRGVPTTAKLNKGSVQRQREIELNANAVAEGMDTCETASVIDQRVVPLSSNDSAKPELVVKTAVVVILQLDNYLKAEQQQLLIHR